MTNAYTRNEAVVADDNDNCNDDYDDDDIDYDDMDIKGVQVWMSNDANLVLNRDTRFCGKILRSVC